MSLKVFSAALNFKMRYSFNIKSNERQSIYCFRINKYTIRLAALSGAMWSPSFSFICPYSASIVSR